MSLKDFKNWALGLGPFGAMGQNLELQIKATTGMIWYIYIYACIYDAFLYKAFDFQGWSSVFLSR